MRAKTEPTDWEKHIRSLMPGAEIDALIHERIMGKTITCSRGILCADIPPYSTDLTSAYLPVDLMIRENPGTGFCVTYQPTKNWPNEKDPMPPDEKWCAMIGLSGTDMLWRDEYAHTHELAVCRILLTYFTEEG